MGDLDHHRSAMRVHVVGELAQPAHTLVLVEEDVAEGRRAVGRDDGRAADHGERDAALRLLGVIEPIARLRHAVLGIGGLVRGRQEAVAQRQMLEPEGLEERIGRGHGCLSCAVQSRLNSPGGATSPTGIAVGGAIRYRWAGDGTGGRAAEGCEEESMRRWTACGIAALGMLAAAPAHAQAKSEIAITRQPGILYLASHVMEEHKLIEAHAAKAGIADLKVNWLNLSGGGAQTDALLAGSVDIVNTGTGNLLLLWDRTRGRVKGIIGSSAQPVLLLSREERIRTLADIRPEDKMAVPTVN